MQNEICASCKYMYNFVIFYLVYLILFSIFIWNNKTDYLETIYFLNKILKFYFLLVSDHSFLVSIKDKNKKCPILIYLTWNDTFVYVDDIWMLHTRHYLNLSSYPDQICFRFYLAFFYSLYCHLLSGLFVDSQLNFTVSTLTKLFDDVKPEENKWDTK